MVLNSTFDRFRLSLLDAGLTYRGDEPDGRLVRSNEVQPALHRSYSLVVPGRNAKPGLMPGAATEDGRGSPSANWSSEWVPAGAPFKTVKPASVTRAPERLQALIVVLAEGGLTAGHERDG